MDKLFLSAIPGHAYSSDFNWEKNTDPITELDIWKSFDAYNAWFKDADSLVLSEGLFKTIVYGSFLLLIISFLMRFPWFPTKIGVIMVILIFFRLFVFGHGKYR